MRRYPSRDPSYSSFSFGPGPLSPALKALIASNVALFLAAWIIPELIALFGLRPADVVLEGRVWQLVDLHVSSRQRRPHPLQHAGALDVRNGARTVVGNARVPSILRHRWCGCCRLDDPRLLDRTFRSSYLLHDHDRSIRRDLRVVAGVRTARSRTDRSCCTSSFRFLRSTS